MSQPHKTPASFYRTFVIVFAIGLIAAVALTHAVSTKRIKDGQAESAAEFNQLPILDHLDPETTSAPAAREKKELFVLWNSQIGRGLDLQKKTDYFDWFFPGYTFDELSADSWHGYFGLNFNSGIYLPADIEAVAYLSHLGCLKIFQSVGADMLLFGSSETAQGVLVQNLHNEFGGRVLNCTRGGAGVNTVVRASEWMKTHSAHKAKAAIWGYSRWSAFLTRPRYDVVESEEQQEYANMESPNTVVEKPKLTMMDVLSSSGKKQFPMDWTMFFPDLSLGNKKIKSEAHKIWQGGFAFSGYPKSRNDLFEAWAEQAGPLSPELRGMTEDDCNLKKAEAQLDQALENLLQVSEKVYLFLIPITPLRTKDGPKCFLPSLTKLLQSKQSARVIVKTSDWDDYGLQYSDYIHTAPTEYEYQLDPSHLNWQGAQKVTKRIGDWIKEVSK